MESHRLEIMIHESAGQPVAQSLPSTHGSTQTSRDLRTRNSTNAVPPNVQTAKRQRSLEDLAGSKRQCSITESFKSIVEAASGQEINNRFGNATYEPVPISSPQACSPGSTVEDSDEVRQAAMEQALGPTAPDIPPMARIVDPTALLERELAICKEDYRLLLQTLLQERRHHDELSEQYTLLREEHEELREEYDDLYDGHEELLQTYERLEQRCDRLSADARSDLRQYLRRNAEEMD